MIMQDFHTMSITMPFKSPFCLHSVIGREGAVKVYVRQPAEMVNEDGGSGVSLIGLDSFQLRNQTWGRRLELIYGDTLPGSHDERFVNFTCLVAPWTARPVLWLSHTYKKRTLELARLEVALEETRGMP
jgi:hypothetical protein